MINLSNRPLLIDLSMSNLSHSQLLIDLVWRTGVDKFEDASTNGYAYHIRYINSQVHFLHSPNVCAFHIRYTQCAIPTFALFISGTLSKQYKEVRLLYQYAVRTFALIISYALSSNVCAYNMSV